MLNRLKDKQEKICQILDKIRLKSSNGALILVEGQKDESALRNLGVDGKILTVKSGGRSFFDIIYLIQDATVSEVILLLDFDRRGKEGTKRLKQNLERSKIKVNVEFWQELFGLMYRDIQCIESIPSYLENLKLKIQK